MVYMKKETSLNLTKSEIGTGNILAVAANIVARFCTGCAARPAPNPHRGTPRTQPAPRHAPHPARTHWPRQWNERVASPASAPTLPPAASPFLPTSLGNRPPATESFATSWARAAA